MDERNCSLKRKQQCLNWAMKNDLKGTEIDGIRQGKVPYITVGKKNKREKGDFVGVRMKNTKYSIFCIN